MTEKEEKQARQAYAALCGMLYDRKWHYDRDDKEMSISCGVQGDDIPMKMNVFINAEAQTARLVSHLPFDVPAARRDAVVAAICAINYNIYDGCFDYNYNDDHILFRLSVCYADSLVGKGLFGHMMSVSCFTVDEYNDKLLLVVKSGMTPEEAAAFIVKEDK